MLALLLYNIQGQGLAFCFVLHLGSDVDPPLLVTAEPDHLQTKITFILESQNVRPDQTLFDCSSRFANSLILL